MVTKRKVNAEPVVQMQNEIANLAYQIFFNTDAGKRLLYLLEMKYFYAPVAEPNSDSNWAYFNEGRNHMIRQLRSWGQSVMSGSQAVDKKTMKRKTK